jgi:DNA transposition AAA+ family ATPase
MSDSPFAPGVKFFETQQYKRFAEFCDDCREYCYIGVCHGAAGVGKTWAARYYTRWDFIDVTPIIRTHHTVVSDPPIEVKDCRAVLYTPEVITSPHAILAAIDILRTKLNYAVVDAKQANQDCTETHRNARNYTELIIIDEADRLPVKSLEQLRDIYDRGNYKGRLGLVLVGMSGLEKKLARYAQLYSRVGFVHSMGTVSRQETIPIIEYKWQQLNIPYSVEDPTTQETIAAIINITNCNLRLIKRLFEQIARVLMINGLDSIDKEVVHVASEMLVIGSN